MADMVMLPGSDVVLPVLDVVAHRRVAPEVPALYMLAGAGDPMKRGLVVPLKKNAR